MYFHILSQNEDIVVLLQCFTNIPPRAMSVIRFLPVDLLLSFLCLRVDFGQMSGACCVSVMVFNATPINISTIYWRSVLLVEATGVPGENHRPVTIY